LAFVAVLFCGCGVGDRIEDAICTTFTLGTSNCGSVPDIPDFQPNPAFLSDVAAFELPTATTDVLSDAALGTGRQLEWAYGIVVDPSEDRALVVDRYARVLLEVDLVAGDRGLISGPGRGTGRDFTGPGPLDLDATRHRAYVVDFGAAVVAVDLATGNRTTLTGAGAGSGPAVQPGWIAFDPVSDRILITDYKAQAVFAVDPGTGERSLVSGAARGSGPVLSQPGQIAMNPAAGVLYLVDSGEKALFEIDLATGDRSIVSPAAEALPLDEPLALVHDAVGLRVLVADKGYEQLVSIDLATGDRTLLDGAPASKDVWGMAIDEARNRVLLARK
jgi:DNA-binding beta-propeller fold protein YncE